MAYDRSSSAPLLGGVYAEILRDTTAPSPVSPGTARQALGKAQSAGARGRAPVDLDGALPISISRFSAFVAEAGEHSPFELEINPVIAGPNGALPLIPPHLATEKGSRDDDEDLGVSDEGIVIILNRPRSPDAINKVMIQEVTGGAPRALWSATPKRGVLCFQGGGPRVFRRFRIKGIAAAGDRQPSGVRVRKLIFISSSALDCPNLRFRPFTAYLIGAGWNWQ